MLRITGGEFRGRVIQTPPGDKTRPTQAKLRQALFNSIQMSVPGAVVLDLFAGSGSLGFEALSRGAEKVVFAESGRSQLKLLEKNIATLGVGDRAEIVAEPLLSSGALRRISSFAPYGIVLADPPYADGWELKLIDQCPWEQWLESEGLFCLEWGAQKSQVSELPEQAPFLAKAREKAYGDSILTTYLRPSSG